MKLNTTASILSAAAAFAVLLSGPAFAQAVDPGHPRVNEIQGRIDNQENRILRAASYDVLGSYLRCASRHDYLPTYHVNGAGFRVARTFTVE